MLFRNICIIALLINFNISNANTTELKDRDLFDTIISLNPSLQGKVDKKGLPFKSRTFFDTELSEDKKLLISYQYWSKNEALIRIWNTETLSLEHRTIINTFPISKIRFEPINRFIFTDDNKSVLMSGSAGDVLVWEFGHDLGVKASCKGYMGANFDKNAISRKKDSNGYLFKITTNDHFVSLCDTRKKDAIATISNNDRSSWLGFNETTEFLDGQLYISPKSKLNSEQKIPRMIQENKNIILLNESGSFSKDTLFK